MAVTHVADEQTFEKEYPRVRPWLLAALEYNENGLSEKQMLSELREGIYQLWVSENAACLSCIIPNWNDKRICCLTLIGGNKGAALREIFEVGMPVLTDFAKTHACQGLLGIGRAGWTRIASRYGFEVLNEKHFYKEVS